MFNFLTRRQFTSYGKDFRVANNVVVKRGGTVGNHVAIDHGFYCTVPFAIKDYVHISPYCTVIGGKDTFFEMGNFSGLSAGCRIICASDELKGNGIPNPTVPSKYRDKINHKPVHISDFVIIGTNSIICPGVYLEEGIVIGANSFQK